MQGSTLFRCKQRHCGKMCRVFKSTFEAEEKATFTKLAERTSLYSGCDKSLQKEGPTSTSCYKSLQPVSSPTKSCRKQVPEIRRTARLVQGVKGARGQPILLCTTKACAKHFPVLFCAAKLAESTCQCYVVLHNFAESTSQYNLALQSL